MVVDSFSDVISSNSVVVKGSADDELKVVVSSGIVVDGSSEVEVDSSSVLLSEVVSSAVDVASSFSVVASSEAAADDEVPSGLAEVDISAELEASELESTELSDVRSSLSVAFDSLSTLDADDSVLETSTTDDADFSEVESSPLPSNRESSSFVDPDPSTDTSVVISESVTSVSKPVASLSMSSSVNGDDSVVSSSVVKSISDVRPESSTSALMTPSANGESDESS